MASHNRFWRIDDQLQIDNFRYGGGLSFPYHRHDVYSLVFCFRGVRQTVQAGCHETQGAGEVMAVSPGVLHSSSYPLADGPCEGVSLDVPWSVLKRAVGRKLRARLSQREVLVFNSKQKQGRAELLAHDLTCLEAGSRDSYKGMLLVEQIIELVVSEWPGDLIRFDSSLPPQQLPRHAFIRAVEYLNKCPRQGLDWDALSREIGMSYSRFRVLFKRSTGFSPGYYYNSILMNRAKLMLQAPAEPVLGVARQLGFASASHFGHVFRGFTGLSPVEFREWSKWGVLEPIQQYGARRESRG